MSGYGDEAYGDEPWGGDGVSSVKIRIQTDEAIPARVQGVVVDIFQANGAFVTSGTSNVLGEVTVSLISASYDVLFYKPGVSVIPAQPMRITVDSAALSNTFVVTVHVRILPESQDPSRCRVSGYVLGADGKPTRDCKLSFLPIPDITVINANIVSPQHPLDVQADEDGYFEFDLLRGVSYQAYFIVVETLISQPATLPVVVPNLPAVSLDRLIFPLPVSVVFSDATKILPLSAGANGTTTAAVTFSDSSVRKLFPLWGRIDLVSSDPSVVAVTLQSDGVVGLSPLKVGTASISAVRTIPSQAYWSNPPVFVSGLLDITVT